MEFPTRASDSNQREGTRDLCTLIDTASVWAGEERGAGNGSAGNNAQFADCRAADRLSAPRGEREREVSCNTGCFSQRLNGMVCNARSNGTICSTPRIDQLLLKRDELLHTVNHLKGEARALHYQPAPALTLTMICLSCSRSAFDRWRSTKHY